ncbi:aminotransferase class V-fold PLP-dependent enzyme [Thiothrix subterranea]|uniref:Aminotransferase class V-fold PLP-dependent enzyme n=1 Tax=Thiothrix subterranea TaxID=2735563 RepID=A0AA51MTB5_9GAMM|nr:aminotransferase class V-fold PLP-dependent enzyme [Thiothrix subterranea]MDQ5767056.1 aminotransferase class V-fold PLP-dependent enzyme [Thiothrix subterranea]WML88082.1 aminotransferase class V-fold PLP-dependent enzyme [Thiothrix subterranea]
MPTPESRFPALQNCLYLNHAAVAPWPQVTADAVQAFAAENARQGTLNYPHWLTVEQALREQARELLNAPAAGDIALVKNTSEGLSFVAYGLDWKAGDNVVGIRQEFPSNRYVWQSLASQGVEFRQLDLREYPDDPETALLALCDSRTRLLSISAVQYTNGLRMDLAKIGAFCRAKGILLCVDAIQQIGAIPFDVQQVQADFVVADGHKWMLGPEGLALFYVRREVLESLRLTQYGWHMAEGLTDYTMEDYQPALDARRFECGSPNMLGIHALHASLGVLLEIGMDAVWEQLSARVQYLLDGLQALPDMEILNDTRIQRRSGIVTFRSRRAANEALFKRLQTQGIFCAIRGGGIRLSPHFYTPFAQLQQVLDVLKTSH